MDEITAPEPNKDLANVPEVPKVEVPTEEVTVAEEPRKPYIVKDSRLDLLPDNIKKDLHELIGKGYGGLRVKKVIEDRYLGKTTFLPATKETFENYIRAHREEIMNAVTAQKSLLESTKESLQDMKAVIDSAENQTITLDDKKKLILSLYNRCEARIRLIEAFNSGFLSSQFEQVIGAYIREQRAILELYLKIQDQLKAEAGDGNIYTEFENLAYVWLATVINVYKTVHQDNKLLEFQGLLKGELQKAVAMYQQQMENDKK